MAMKSEMRRRLFLLAGVSAVAGAGMIAIAGSLPPGHAEGARPARPGRAERAFLPFARTPRRPGNLLERIGVAGRSAAGRPIRLRQLGDPALPGEVLVFGCIHGDECAGRRILPLAGGCPDPRADIYLVPNLNPDGLRLGTRLNGRGVDLNRNFPAGWRPIGSPGEPQYSGPHPLSEPETRLAARIVRRVRPEVSIWLHQHGGAPFVRAWGRSVEDGRRLAAIAGLPFHELPWPAGTAPNWQNHRFPTGSSFVVELPQGPLQSALKARLDWAILHLARSVGED